jgi:hypothetical protein
MKNDPERGEGCQEAAVPLTTRDGVPNDQTGTCEKINLPTRNYILITDGGVDQSGAGLDQVILRRPIARWVDDRKVPANPATKQVVDSSVGTPLIPRRRIAGVHVNRVRSETIPVRGFRDGRYVLAIAPEHASIDVFDSSERDSGEPALDVTESWVPLVAVFTPGEKRPVVVPRKEVDL